ncbi:hypothetical protein F66182_8265 [Fusarium sp. NRRL 66182]|nr:hypothetical protein F66182_8265 [Fusarium sp. NRRL 66182]
MAELASAVLSFVIAGRATWRKIDDFVSSIKNAPRNVEHWRVIGGVLQESLKVMDARVRSRQENLTEPEQNLFRAIEKFRHDFIKDLKELERTLPETTGGSRFWEPLKLKSKLQEDSALLTRLSRNVQIFQLSAFGLSLLDPQPATVGGIRVTRVHQFLEDLSDDNPEKLENDEQLHLKNWREALYEVADVAAQREFPDPSADIPPHTPSTPDGDETPRRPSGVGPRELRYRFEAAVSRAKRMYKADLPIMAKKAQDEAFQYGGQMQAMDAHAISFSDVLDMEITYIRIVKACVPHDASCGALAWERLQKLKTDLMKQSGPRVNPDYRNEQEELGKLCADLRDRDGAVDFLRLSLDAYVLNRAEFADKIQRISMLVCEQYECMGQWNNLDAFKKVLIGELRYDPTSEPNALAETIRWCRQNGYDAVEKDGRLHIPEESYMESRPLHRAVADNVDMAIVHQLIPTVDHALEDENGDTPLLVAVQHSNNAALTALLRIAGSVHVRDTKRGTPLHRCDNPDTLKLLLEEIKKPVFHSSPDERGFELVCIDSTDAYGETALHKACEKGRADMVELLVAEGANVNLVSGSNETPLMITCEPCELKGKGKLGRERRRIVETLVNRNADITCVDDRGKPAVQRSLKTRGYSDAEMERMLTPDPSRRFARNRSRLARNSASTVNGGPSSYRPSSPGPPIELAADAPSELPSVPRYATLPNGYELPGSEPTWPELQLAELPGSTPVTSAELEGSAVSEVLEPPNTKSLINKRIKSIKRKMGW